MCVRCVPSFWSLRLVAGKKHAEGFIWSETPFPFDDGSVCRGLVWREAWRLLLYRLTPARLRKAR